MYTLFYRLPRLTALSVLVIFISGFFAILTLGRQEDPTLVERYGYVLTTLPGADAERVEATVTEPLERRLLELPELMEIKSVSRANVSQITLTIREDLSRRDVDNAWTLIRQQADLARADLPPIASTPFVERSYVGASTMVVSLSWQGDGPAPMPVMSRLASTLEDRFLNLNATEETETMGLPEEEVRVVADPEALAAAGLSLSDAAGLIAAADAKAPAGQVRSEGNNLGVEIGGAFDEIARVRAVPLLQRPDGTALRVGDVADVVKGIEDPATNMAFSNGKRAIFVTAYISANQRVDLWGASAREIVSDFAAEIPSDIGVDVIFDQSKYTEARLNGLAMNLVFSALIVFAVLFFVMGWRAAIAVGMALPLTVALVLTLFKFFSFPLHQMSVTGLVISLGLLIDNAIVVVDEFDQERRAGRSAPDAIEHSLGKLFGPLFASTLTTALAFAPIAFMPGGAGEFIGMIGMSVMFSVVMSFFVAVTVIPAIAGCLSDLTTSISRRLGRPPRNERPKRFWRDGIKFGFLSDGYRWSIERVLRFPLLGLAIGIIPVYCGIMLGMTLPSQFFPQTERDQFQVELTLSPQSTIADAETAALRATELISNFHSDVSGVHFTVGEPSPRVYYNAFNFTRGVPGFASGFVQLENAETAREIVGDIQSLLRHEFPSARVLATPFEQGPPSEAPIAFFLRGDNLDILNQYGNEARRILAETPGVSFTHARLQLGAPIITIRADEAAAAISGTRLTALASDLRAELEGVPAGSILEGTEDIPVRVIAPAQRRGELADLRSKTIANGRNGAGVPLSALGEVTLDPRTASIIRLNGDRVNEIYGFVEPYALPTPIVEDFSRRMNEAGFELPPGYDQIQAGQASDQADAMGNLAGLAIPLMLVMMGAVAMVFNSFRMALLIMAVGVMSMGLAFGGVWMFNLPLGFNAIVGALGLFGIAINGSIVVLSLLKGNAAAMADDVIAQREVVVDATRHIVATTLTTMGGFVPIILTGDVFWMPLATAIAGGVAGAALLALYFTPAVFRIMTMKPITRFVRLIFGRGWTHPARTPAE